MTTHTHRIHTRTTHNTSTMPQTAVLHSIDRQPIKLDNCNSKTTHQNVSAKITMVQKLIRSDKTQRKNKNKYLSNVITEHAQMPLRHLAETDSTITGACRRRSWPRTSSSDCGTSGRDMGRVERLTGRCCPAESACHGSVALRPFGPGNGDGQYRMSDWWMRDATLGR